MQILTSSTYLTSCRVRRKGISSGMGKPEAPMPKAKPKSMPMTAPERCDTCIVGKDGRMVKEDGYAGKGCAWRGKLLKARMG